MFKFIAALAALAVSGSAAAQTMSPDQQLNDLTGKLVQLYGDKGFKPNGWEHRGSLNAGQSEQMTLTLSGGSNYQVAGICQVGCENIDVHLYDAGGREVAKDTESDDVPIVTVSTSGTYTAQITMVTCDSGPCLYELKEFQN